jgi:hypothetical protein
VHTVRTPFSTDGTKTRSTLLPTSDCWKATPLSRGAGLDAQPDLGELARAARLLLVAVARLAAAADGLAVRDARLLERDAHAEAPAQPLDDHLQLDLALARDDRLMDLVVDADRWNVGSSW